MPGHSAAGRIKSIKNFSAPNRNKTRDLPACSTVPDPTAPPRTRHRHTHIYFSPRTVKRDPDTRTFFHQEMQETVIHEVRSLVRS